MLFATPLKSRTIDCLLSKSNLGATNLAPCAFFFTKVGTLIFKVSADCFNFKYSSSLTRKLICFGSFRNGSFRFSLAKLSRSLIQSHLSIFLIQSDYHMFKCKLFPSILAHIRGLASVVFASHYRGTNTACWGVPQSPYILSQLRNI